MMTVSPAMRIAVINLTYVCRTSSTSAVTAPASVVVVMVVVVLWPEFVIPFSLLPVSLLFSFFPVVPIVPATKPTQRCPSHRTQPREYKVANQSSSRST